MSGRAYLLAPRLVEAFTGDANEVEQKVRELAANLEEGEKEILLGMQLDEEAMDLLPLAAIRWLLALRWRGDAPLDQREVQAVLDHSRDDGATSLLARDLVRYHRDQVEQYRGRARAWVRRAQDEIRTADRFPRG